MSTKKVRESIKWVVYDSADKTYLSANEKPSCPDYRFDKDLRLADPFDTEEEAWTAIYGCSRERNPTDLCLVQVKIRYSISRII